MAVNLQPALFLPRLHILPLLDLLTESVALTWNLTLLGSLSGPLRLVQRLAIKVPGITTVVITILTAFWSCPSLWRVSTIDPGASTPSASVAAVGPPANAAMGPTRCNRIPG